MTRARPCIGLSTYGRNGDNWFSLPAEYVDAIRRAGGMPILLPPGEGRLDEWFELIDALVLPGGGDMEPATYGGSPHPDNYKVDRDRDADELAMARHAIDARMPILAICRGMQVLNVACGGDLIAHVPDVVGATVPHRSADKKPISHHVAVVPDSHLAAVLGATEATVASWHHQALDRIADGFRAVAHADDGLVEAIELAGHPFLLAVQWHPELTALRDSSQQHLFDALVAAARAQPGGGG